METWSQCERGQMFFRENICYFLQAFLYTDKADTLYKETLLVFPEQPKAILHWATEACMVYISLKTPRNGEIRVPSTKWNIALGIPPITNRAHTSRVPFQSNTLRHNQIDHLQRLATRSRMSVRTPQLQTQGQYQEVERIGMRWRALLHSARLLKLPEKQRVSRQSLFVLYYQGRQR